MNRIETANELFMQGYNCAQALLTAYGVDLGLDRHAALRIASVFGGGIAHKGETCGAVTGALMVIGLKHGGIAPDPDKKMKAYEIARKFVETFEARNNPGSIMCNELLGFRIRPGLSLHRNEEEIIKQKCPKYVQDAAEIIEGILGI